MSCTRFQFYSLAQQPWHFKFHTLLVKVTLCLSSSSFPIEIILCINFTTLSPNKFDIFKQMSSTPTISSGSPPVKYIYPSMMKISVITDISVLRFYGYIGYIGDIFGYIGDISADILEKNIGA